MKRSMLMMVTMMITGLLVIVLAVSFADSLTVMDEYDLLTPDEIADGVLLDPESLFAYALLEDDTVMLVRYTWVVPHMTVPMTVEGLPVSWIGAHAFTDTPVKEIVLPWGIGIDPDAFSYSDVKTVRICENEETEKEGGEAI